MVELDSIEMACDTCGSIHSVSEFNPEAYRYCVVCKIPTNQRCGMCDDLMHLVSPTTRDYCAIRHFMYALRYHEGLKAS